jgi:hypothetical protein
MFRKRKRKKQEILIAHPAPATPEGTAADQNLPFIDNETLENFLADPGSVDMLPVNPDGYRREIQRMIVSVFLRDASERARSVERTA